VRHVCTFAVPADDAGVRVRVEATQRTGVVGRVKMQLITEATHRLESAGQGSAMSLSSCEWGKGGHWQVVSRVQMQLTTEVSHRLESRGQALSRTSPMPGVNSPVLEFALLARGGEWAWRS